MTRANNRLEQFYAAQGDLLEVLKALQERIDALAAAHNSLQDRLADLMTEVAQVRDLLRRVGSG